MKKLESVKEVKVDVDKGMVLLEHEENEELRDEALKKLNKLGYPEQGKGGTGAKVKSYVSCAIGRMNN